MTDKLQNTIHRTRLFPGRKIRKRALSLLGKNRISFFFTEIMIHILTVVMITSFLNSLISVILPNTDQYLHSPLIIPAWFLTGILLSVWSFLEIDLLVRLFECARKGITPFSGMFFAGIGSDFLRTLNPKNWMMLVLAGCLVPFTNLFSGRYSISRIITVQPFSVLISDSLLFCLFLIPLWAILIYLILRWILVFHIYILEGKNFPAAACFSRTLIREHLLHLLFEILYTPLKNAVLFFLLAGGINLLLFGLICTAGKEYLIFKYSLLSEYLLYPGILILADAFTVMTAVGIISAVYYELRTKGKWRIARNTSRHIRSGFFIPASAVVYGLFCILSMTVLNNAPSLLMDRIFPKNTQITAHRGYTANAPENTIGAFRDAIRIGYVDWIELDVQETKDGVVVVFHDDTLQRLASDPRRVCDMTWDELKTLEVQAAGFHGKPVSGSIPSLEEVLKLCRGRIRLNIELKPFRETPELEEHTAQMIRKYSFEKDCVVSCKSYASLERVKAVNSEIRTGCVLMTGLDSCFNQEYCEFVSAATYFVTPDIIQECHEHNLEVHTWTIENAEKAEIMLKAGADNLITNDPISTASKIAEVLNLPNTLYDYWKKHNGDDQQQSSFTDSEHAQFS